jgi:hypothetical protein
MLVQAREVHGFDSVELRGIGTLYVESADEESLIIQAAEPIASSIVTDVTDGRLVIRFDPWKALTQWASAGQVTMWLKARSLSSLAIAGSGLVQSPELAADTLQLSISGAGTIYSGIRARDLRVAVSGTADITLVGVCERQDVRLSGSGSYHAQRLQSRDAKVAINGAGRADVAVEQTLDVQIGGAGTVTYSGNPQVNQRIGGFGKVERVHVS